MLPPPWPSGAEIRSGRGRAVRAHARPGHAEFRGEYQITQTFSAAELAQAADSALAQTLQISVPMLQAMLALLDQSPELALTELRTRAAGATAVARSDTEPITRPLSPRDAGADEDSGAVSPGDSQDLPVGLRHRSTVVALGDRQGARDDSEGDTGGHVAVAPGDSHTIEDVRGSDPARRPANRSTHSSGRC